MGRRPFLTLIGLICISVLIFYQIIITLILPLRFNIFILMVEVFILFIMLFRLLWPY